MPITKSYVKEGTYRSEVVQALTRNNPYRSQRNNKQASLQVSDVFAEPYLFLVIKGCLCRSPENCGGFWCLLLISYIHMHATFLYQVVFWESIYTTEITKKSLSAKTS